MAARLTDVDVIIGGDSHTLLGDFSAIGITASSGPYPDRGPQPRRRSGLHRPGVGIRQAFGLLQVRFDERAAVESCRGEVTLPIGDDFRQKDASGAFVAVDAAHARADSRPACGSGAARRCSRTRLPRLNSRALPAASMT
jgi:5'-nucleotidase/UDP-sugar diphosphatase